MLDDPVKKWIVGALAAIVIVVVVVWGAVNTKKVMSPEIDRSKPPADYVQGYMQKTETQSQNMR